MSAYEELSEILRECGAKISFSKNCASGLLPKDTCQCWRCKSGRGEQVTEESERQAEEQSKQAQKDQRERIRVWLKEHELERKS